MVLNKSGVICHLSSHTPATDLLSSLSFSPSAARKKSPLRHVDLILVVHHPDNDHDHQVRVGKYLPGLVPSVVGGDLRIISTGGVEIVGKSS